MTGPEHYREAERLLAESRTILRPNDEGHCEADRLIAEALVRATLARVAAYALAQPISDSDTTAGHPGQEHYEDWVIAVEMSDTAVETGASAELAAIRGRVRRIHRPVDGGIDHDGSCRACGDDCPCPTIRALDGVEAGESR